MSKDKSSLKSLSKDKLIEIIARQNAEINFLFCKLEERKNNSIYFAKQVVEKDKEIKQLKDCNESLSNKFDKESDMQNEIDILKYNVEGLEQQLKEKDKEIEKLKANCNASIRIATAAQKQIVRHQVYEEIKYKLLDFSSPYWSYNKNGGQYITSEDLYEYISEILYPIEKGE